MNLTALLSLKKIGVFNMKSGCNEIGYGEGISQDEIDLGIFVGFGKGISSTELI